jgi:hypothetical protein
VQVLRFIVLRVVILGGLVAAGIVLIRRGGGMEYGLAALCLLIASWEVLKLGVMILGVVRARRLRGHS